jgi:hypothetical protein
MKLTNFKDGIVNLYNSLANTRSATSSNVVQSQAIPFQQLNQIYKSGLGSKIIRIKAGYSLKNGTLNFSNDNDIDKDFYNKKLAKKVKKAWRWSLVFGRGIVVINDGNDLSLPLEGNIDKDRCKFDVFSGDVVSVVSYFRDLSSENYMKPEFYNVRGFNFHHTRVIDFTYVEPIENDSPIYNYGGISEFELIYNQIINDGVIERSSASIVEKNSSFFYKIKGFKQSLANKQEESILKFYSLAEDKRSIYGAGLIDSEDDVLSVNQSLTNLKDADDISLRRIALVTGIPLPMLVGEQVEGLGSSGDQEKTSFNEMLEILQDEYLIDPINSLFEKLGMEQVEFKEGQNTTPLERIEYEEKAIGNAMKLYDLGYDIEEYLMDKGLDVKAKDSFGNEFPEDEEIKIAEEEAEES